MDSKKQKTKGISFKAVGDAVLEGVKISKCLLKNWPEHGEFEKVVNITLEKQCKLEDWPILSSKLNPELVAKVVSESVAKAVSPTVSTTGSSLDFPTVSASTSTSTTKGSVSASTAVPTLLNPKIVEDPGNMVLINKNDIKVTVTSNLQGSMYKTETSPSQYASSLFENLPKEITVFQMNISPGLVDTLNIDKLNRLQTILKKVPVRDRTFIQSTIINASNNEICSLTILPDNLDEVVSLSKSQKYKLKPNVYKKTLKNNKKNKKFIHETCSQCINFGSLLKKYMPKQYSVGDIMLYDSNRPYILQTIYSGLNNYQLRYTTIKYVLALLNPKEFMLYELYINFLGFSDMGVMVNDNYVVGVEIKRLLKLLNNMLELLNA
jgi:hypothetical protein